MVNVESLKQKFHERKDISNVNKDHFINFFKGYNCAPASAEKLCNFLPYVLSKCDDVVATMNNEAELVAIFDDLYSTPRPDKKLKDKVDKKGKVIEEGKIVKGKILSPSSYKIILDCTKTFCRRLNNDILPDTFKRVKQLTKKDKAGLMRVNKKGYKTYTWEDALKIAEQTNSIQLKALVLSQLEGGLRPKELESLDYSDVKQDGKFFVFSIYGDESKTARGRKVVLFHAAPYLRRWLDMHPTKHDPKSPLWVMEHNKHGADYRKGGKNNRYKYQAIKQAVKRLAKLAGFEKGISLYMMRHSSVALKKKENMPLEVAAEMMGHGVGYYTQVYGKLTDEEQINRVKAHYGEAVAGKENKESSLLCSICNTINEPNKELCEKCSQPLTIAAAMKHDKSATLQKELDAMKEQMAQFELAMKGMALHQKLNK